MKNKEKKIPHIYYLYLHFKIWEKNRGEIISEKDLKRRLFEWRLPEKIKPLIIKEMIILGLLEKDKRYLLKIKRPEFSEEKINKYYEQLGVF